MLGRQTLNYLVLIRYKVAFFPDMIYMKFVHGTRTCGVEQLAVAFAMVHILGAVVYDHRVEFHAFGQISRNDKRSFLKSRRGFGN